MTDRWARRVFFLLVGWYALLGAMLHRGGPSAREELTLSSLARRGQALYRAKACHACHQIHGLGGFLGPDLTNIVRRRSRDDIGQVLDTGRLQMPVFKMNDDEVDAVFAYLDEMNGTGTSTTSWRAPAIARVAWPERFELAQHERDPVRRGRLQSAEAIMRVNSCATCHRPFTVGRVGAPDLTLARTRRLRSWVTRQLREGGGGMPGFSHLTDEERELVADYVWWLGERRGEIGRAIAGPLARVAWSDIPWFEID